MTAPASTEGRPMLPPFLCVDCREMIFFEASVERDGDTICQRCDVDRAQLDLFDEPTGAATP